MASKKRKKAPVLAGGKKEAKGGDKVVDSLPVEHDGVSLLEKVKKETEEWTPGRGKVRSLARMAFMMWLSLPVRYRGAPDSVLEALGLSGDMLDLARIKSSGRFEEVCGVGHGTLALWRKEFEESEEGKDHRAFFRKMMREGLGALYRKLIENGDAERFKVFAGYVEGWMPGMQVQHSGDVSGLTAEERASLDRLISKNRL